MDITIDSWIERIDSWIEHIDRWIEHTDRWIVHIDCSGCITREMTRKQIYICKENISISIENIEFIKLNKADPWNLNCIYQGFYKRFDKRQFQYIKYYSKRRLNT